MTYCQQVFVLVLVLLIGGCHIDQPRQRDYARESTDPSRPARLDSVIISPMPKYTPSFTLPTLSGDSVRLSDFRGETVLVHFWAAWCPPCLRMIPVLSKLDQAENIHVLSILTQPPASDNFLKQHEIPYLITLDDGSTAEALGHVYSLPTSFIVAPDGIVTYRLVGPFSVAEVEALLRPAKRQ